MRKYIFRKIELDRIFIDKKYFKLKKKQNSMKKKLNKWKNN